MVQLDEMKYEVFKAEQAVERFVNDNMEQLKEEVRTQFNLSAETPINIHCIQAHVTAYFYSDRGHTVYYSCGTWH